MSHGADVIEVNLERCLDDDLPITDPSGESRPILMFGDVKDFGARQTLLQGQAGTVLPELARRVRDLRARRRGEEPQWGHPEPREVPPRSAEAERLQGTCFTTS